MDVKKTMVYVGIELYPISYSLILDEIFKYIRNCLSKIILVKMKKLWGVYMQTVDWIFRSVKGRMSVELPSIASGDILLLLADSFVLF